MSQQPQQQQQGGYVGPAGMGAPAMMAYPPVLLPYMSGESRANACLFGRAVSLRPRWRRAQGRVPLPAAPRRPRPPPGHAQRRLQRL